MTLPQVTKLVKVTILVVFSCFPTGFTPFGGFVRSEIAECEGKPCPLWCQFFYMELGLPGLAEPTPFRVFCDPTWSPAREPLLWYPQQKINPDS